MFFRKLVTYRRKNQRLASLGHALMQAGAARLDVNSLDCPDPARAIDAMLSHVTKKRQLLWRLLERATDSGHPVVGDMAARRLSGDGARFDVEGFTQDTTHALETGQIDVRELGDWKSHLELGLLLRLADAAASRTPRLFELADFDHVSTAMAMLRGVDGDAIVRASVAYERILESDPAGVYAQMDAPTKQAYREILETMARRKGTTPVHEAQRIVDGCERLGDNGRVASTGHIGYYLDGARATSPGPARLRADIGLSCLLTVLVAAAAFTVLPPIAGFAGAAALCLLLLASDTAESLLNDVARRRLTPRPLSSLREDACRGVVTAVAVPTLLIDEAHIDRIVARMTENFLASEDAMLVMVLLLDFEDASSREPDARDRRLIAHALSNIDRLNEQHAVSYRPFVVAWRPRSWSATENCWLGYERKRGKLEALFRFIADGTGELEVRSEDVGTLRDARYVVMLDDDNSLLPSTVARLVAGMEHPLNRARRGLDGRVVEGFGVLVPQIVDTDTPAEYLDFASHNTTFDWYGCCLFPGKGIVDPRLAVACLDRRLPPERILSHDTMEGFWLRPGFAGHAIVAERSPTTYLKLCERIHRWTRGNWQNLSVMTGARGDARYDAYAWLVTTKMLKNSLAPLALFGFLAVSIAASSSAGLAIGVGILVAFLPMYVDIVSGLVMAAIRGDRLAVVARGAGGRIVFSALLLLNTPHRALINADAIVRTCWRVATRKRLLEWRAASKVESRGFSWTLPVVYLLTVTPLALLLLSRHLEGPTTSMAAVLLPVAWALSPALLWFISRRGPKAQETPSAGWTDGVEKGEPAAKA